MDDLTETIAALEREEAELGPRIKALGDHTASSDAPYCHHRAEVLAQRGRRERVAQVTPAPGVPFDNGLRLIEEPLDAPWPGLDDPFERATITWPERPNLWQPCVAT